MHTEEDDNSLDVNFSMARYNTEIGEINEINAHPLIDAKNY